MTQQQQYFLVELRSPTYYRDDEKLIVRNIRELKNWVKNDAKYMLLDYGEGQRLNSRMHTGHVYVDVKNSDKPKIVGKVFSFNMLVKDARKLTDKQIEEREDTVLEYWCTKIPKKNLHKLAGFQEIDL